MKGHIRRRGEALLGTEIRCQVQSGNRRAHQRNITASKGPRREAQQKLAELLSAVGKGALCCAFSSHCW